MRASVSQSVLECLVRNACTTRGCSSLPADYCITSCFLMFSWLLSDLSKGSRILSSASSRLDWRPEIPLLTPYCSMSRPSLVPPYIHDNTRGDQNLNINTLPNLVANSHDAKLPDCAPQRKQGRPGQRKGPLRPRDTISPSVAMSQSEHGVDCKGASLHRYMTASAFVGTASNERLGTCNDLQRLALPRQTRASPNIIHGQSTRTYTVQLAKRRLCSDNTPSHELANSCKIF
jgi:hypothetical protein